MDAMANLSTLIDTLVARLGHAARALLWLIAALVCAMVAGLLGTTALIVSLWDARPVGALVAAGIGAAILAALFGVMGARRLRAQRAAATAAAGTPAAWSAPAAPAVAAATANPARRFHPQTWIVALLSLLVLGGSRELVALALRLRAVLALVAHALHVLQLFSRRRAAPPL
jgi:hypothetical protein